MMRSLGHTRMRRVSPTVSSLTTESLRRLMIPRASARPQSMELTTVDKSSDFTWRPVETRMDSSGLSNPEIHKSNGAHRKACSVRKSGPGISGSKDIEREGADKRRGCQVISPAEDSLVFVSFRNYHNPAALYSHRTGF